MPSIYKHEETYVIWLENHEHNATASIYSTPKGKFYTDYSHSPVINGSVSHGDSVKYCQNIEEARRRIQTMAIDLDETKVLEAQVPITD